MCSATEKQRAALAPKTTRPRGESPRGSEANTGLLSSQYSFDGVLGVDHVILRVVSD
jgi:hypothetical protein